MSSKLQLTATFATIETRGELDRVTIVTFAKTSRAVTKDRGKIGQQLNGFSRGTIQCPCCPCCPIVLVIPNVIVVTVVIVLPVARDLLPCCPCYPCCARCPVVPVVPSAHVDLVVPVVR